MPDLSPESDLSDRPMTTKSRLTEWVRLCEQWCEPDWIHWCDGSPTDRALLRKREEDAAFPPSPAPGGGKYVTPTEAMNQIATRCRGALRGKIMFVVPYLRAGDDAGVLVTDSAASASDFYQSSRVGAPALAFLSGGGEFTAHLHLSRNEAGDTEAQSIRCHLSGPATTETACRTHDSHSPRRLPLPMKERPAVPVGESPCLSCPSLCSNRARAIALAAAAKPTV